MNYREKPVRFGKSNPMLGIVTEPPAGTRPNGRGLILLNAGLLHRVGPSRLHVQLARRLAPLGFHVLRFDFPGIGDSDARRDSLSFEEGAVREVSEAMDYLATSRQVRDFCIAGLCSGADAAFLTAVADRRVSALIQLDPWVYRTWKYYPFFFLRKLQNRRSWKNLLSGDTLKRHVWDRLVRRHTADVDGEGNSNVVVSHYARDFPPRTQVEAQLAGLLERHVRMLCIFSGGMPEHVSYERQYRECFPALPMDELVTVRYDGTAEHIFSALHHQRLVVDAASEWLLDGPAPAGEPETKLAVA